jgi:hypothetical protein
VTYYHLVFTLPHELNGWVQLHPEVIYALLFKVVWKTLKAFGADKKRLNGQLGMTAVLHTWGQNLSQHVHLHCLVPGGALTKDRHWHRARSNYLFPVKALSRHYRGNFVSALRSAANRGELDRVTHPGEVDSVLNTLMQKDWVVYSKHCLNRTDSIIGYLARYKHRIAISNQRLIGSDQDQVSFSYKNYQTEQHGVMALKPEEFICHYGILLNRCRKSSITMIRKILSTPAPEQMNTPTCEAVTYPCPKCRKGRLILKHEMAPTTIWGHPQPG